VCLSYVAENQFYMVYIRVFRMLLLRIGTVEPRFTNAPVHEQIFRAKNVSDDEQCLGLRTPKLATAVGDKLRGSAWECQLLVNFGSVHIPD
jgi:hypothetical protein